MKKVDKRIDIQIYRGIAVISVILYHLDSNIFKTGYMGVDVFFLISGFVISNLIYSQIESKTFSVSKFYFQRFRRIVPSLISFILFVQIIIYFFLDHQFIHQTSKGNLFSIFFISNVYFSQISNYFSNAIPLNFIINLWSLSVEEQFYIIFPFIALISKKLSIAKKSVVFVILSLISITFYIEPVFNSIEILKKLFFTYDNFIFYSPFTRAWQFFLGILAMFCNQLFRLGKKKEINSYLFLSFQIIITLLISLNTLLITKNLKLIFIMILFFFLLVFEFNFKMESNHLLKFILFTGNISYSLYLFHQPIFAAVRNYSYYSLNNFDLLFRKDNYFFIFSILLIVYLISFINFKFVENKYRFITKFSLRKFKLFIINLFLSIILIFVSLNSDGYSFRDSRVKTFSQTSELEFIPGTNYLSKKGIQCIDRDSLADGCVFETNKENTTIYIFGDSIMSSLVSGFAEESILEKYTIKEFTRGSCPLLINYCNFYEGSTKYKEITEIKNSIILLGGEYFKLANNKGFSEDLTTTFQILSKHNKVYIFNTFPNPGLNIRMYKLTNNRYPDLSYKQSEKYDSEFDQIINKLEIENLHIINSYNIFCMNNICEFYSPTSYYFIDHAHFSFFGAQKISNYFISNYLDS